MLGRKNSTKCLDSDEWYHFFEQIYEKNDIQQWVDPPQNKM